MLLGAGSRKGMRAHAQACMRALCQAQSRVFAVWQQRQPCLAAAMGLQVRNHNAQFQEIDVVQTHHSGLVRARRLCPALSARPRQHSALTTVQELQLSSSGYASLGNAGLLNLPAAGTL